ncbi:MAG: YbjN domain-containing protein [bacterium]|nr:YbjN domain-containing protein [bacterium]
MHFVGPTHESVYQTVQRYLKEELGKQFLASEDNPVFIVPRGSSFLHVIVTPLDETIDEKILILFIAPLVKDIELSNEVLKKLLRINSVIQIGALAIDKDDWITLNHCLIAETCSQDEFSKILHTLTKTADDLDDLIIHEFGGMHAFGNE